MSRRVVAVAVTAILATIGGCGERQPGRRCRRRCRADHPVNGDLAEVVYALGLGDQVVATDISATYPPSRGRDPEDRLPADARRRDDPGVRADRRPRRRQRRAARGARSAPAGRRARRRARRADRTLEAVAKKIRAVAAALGVPRGGGGAGRAARVGARRGPGARPTAAAGRPADRRCSPCTCGGERAARVRQGQRHRRRRSPPPAAPISAPRWASSTTPSCRRSRSSRPPPTSCSSRRPAWSRSAASTGSSPSPASTRRRPRRSPGRRLRGPVPVRARAAHRSARRRARRRLPPRRPTLD